MITINALKELSNLVKEKTGGKVDIDNLFLFTKSNFSARFGLETVCTFIDFTDDGCYVVTANFIQNAYLQDTLAIIYFDGKGYKSCKEFLDDVWEYSKIDRSILFVLFAQK